MGNATIAKDGNCHHFANHHPRSSSTSVMCFPGSLLSCWPRPEKALFEAHFSAHVSVCGVLVTLCEQPWFQVVATFCLDLCRHTLTSGIRACSPTPYRQRTLLKLHQFANPAVVRTQCVFRKLIFLAGSLFTSGVREVSALSAFQAGLRSSQSDRRDIIE